VFLEGVRKVNIHYLRSLHDGKLLLLIIIDYYLSYICIAVNVVTKVKD